MVNLIVQRIELFLFCLQVHIFAYSKTNEIEYFANDKGWRPMWGDRVYNGSPDYISMTKQMRNADYFTKQADDIGNIDKLKSEAIKLVKPYQVFSEFSKASSVKEDYDKIPTNIHRSVQVNDEIEKENKRLRNVIKETLPNPTEIKPRKAKTLSQFHSYSNVVKEFKDDRSKNINNKNDEESNRHVIIKSASKRNVSSYAVSEETEDHFRTSSNVPERTGYFYKLPINNQLIQEKSNLSAAFYKFLSKYKINNTDYSQNYALSRNTNVRNYSKPEFVFLPIPLTALQHRNSPNHFPLNPLLAVYLSNYGYYLPGSYGPQNQFKNLYGYLASNNIHNNVPFGPYKVFSDTDSSNK